MSHEQLPEEQVRQLTPPLAGTLSPGGTGRWAQGTTAEVKPTILGHAEFTARVDTLDPSFYDPQKPR